MALSSFIRISIIRLASLFYTSKKSKVIFYHDIHSDKQYTVISTPVKLFIKHIQIIRDSGYEIVSEITENYGQIEICFDDGFLGIYDNIELIKELNFPIHLFVISSFLGKENYINKEQLIALNNLLQITISSHTHTHQVLNLISERNIFEEFEKSKNTLEKLLKTEVNSICFPEGKFSEKVIELANKSAYKKQYSSIPGFYHVKNYPTAIQRSLVQFARENEFLAILKGGDHILASWYKMKHFKK
jgi:peptidoglycan/xylan/chitin deacetylase (PgdA/CDA1 family)